MQQIIEYQCETCNGRYCSAELATACETGHNIIALQKLYFPRTNTNETIIKCGKCSMILKQWNIESESGYESRTYRTTVKTEEPHFELFGMWLCPDCFDKIKLQILTALSALEDKRKGE